MTFDRDRPFNDLPPLPPRGVDLETVPVLKHALSASRALAELKGAGALIPNQRILLTGIVMQEARLSSEIENIVTTNDELYQAMASERLPASPHTKEVLRYREALWFGYEQLKTRPLST
ncbi:Fic family protein, partial [Candidatus Parcubacteria bacterium]